MQLISVLFVPFSLVQSCFKQNKECGQGEMEERRGGRGYGWGMVVIVDKKERSKFA